MAYKQTRNFSIANMGKRKGWCLMNCRLGFGINTGKFSSARADMESQRKNGTLHDISTVPTNVAVPVYADTASKYEHVMVYDHGTLYSDGYKVSTGLKGFKFFGWGELCDGQRVVEWTADPKPAQGFLPAKGWWGMGDNDARIGELAKFMRAKFPAYTSQKALGNYYGVNIKRSIAEFQRRTGLAPDGNCGQLTYNKLKQYGFKG